MSRHSIGDQPGVEARFESKARLVPLYFAGRDNEFYRQVKQLESLLAEEAEILEPVALGAPLPEAEAVVFPQLLGEAYRQVKDFKAIKLPVLIVTSEFGSVHVGLGDCQLSQIGGNSHACPL